MDRSCALKTQTPEHQLLSAVLCELPYLCVARRHVCSEVQHLCGRPCDLAEQAGGCQAVCALQPGHAGDHRCASLRHTCKHACTAPSCTHTCGATFGEVRAAGASAPTHS